MKTLRDLLSEEQIAKVRAPLEEAYWLPNKAFTSPEFFQLEATQLLANTWMRVGFEAEAAENGDAYSSTILVDIPIVIWR